MCTAFRSGFCKLLTPVVGDLRAFQRGIKGSISRSITPLPPKPAPYPYRTNRYTKLHSIFDRTTGRMDENSKLIVVEGPVASGKTKFAKELAADLGMYHMPEANLDMWFTNEYGYNFKLADDQLPEGVRSFDIKNFLWTPNHRKSASFQIMQFQVKFSQYVDALAHLLSTGQGVVLERCVYSDFVFIEAMCSQGYVSKLARDAYYDIRKNTIYDFIRPHLIIYLDVSVDKVLEKIKQRNIAAETQTKTLNPSYLQIMEDRYKQNYLKEISTHSELLVYDWSEEGDMEVVIEDIEQLQFKRQDEHDPKFRDWVFELEEDWYIVRNKYSDYKDDLMDRFNIPRFDVPELIATADDCIQFYDVYDKAPGNAFLYGYNARMGDKGLFFKLGVKNRDDLPLIERKIE